MKKWGYNTNINKNNLKKCSSRPTRTDEMHRGFRNYIDEVSSSLGNFKIQCADRVFVVPI